MGCGEGNLERKAGRFGWREAVGAVVVAGAVVAVSIYGAHHFYDKGREHERRNIAAELRDFQENNSATVWMGGPGEGGRFDVGICKVDEQGRKLNYSAGTTPCFHEEITVRTQEGSTTYLDGTLDMEVNEGIIYVTGKLDGLVDFVRRCSRGKCTSLVRDPAVQCDEMNANCAQKPSDYEAHSAEFEEADREFWRLKVRMSYI